MRTHSDSVIADLEEHFSAGVQSFRLNVVIMGPSASRTDASGQLRAYLITQAKKFGASVQPEHKKAIDISEKALEEGHTLMHYEAALVKISELLVVIPDSPGSFCELGYFSMDRQYTSKMVVLINKKYKDKNSFINNGPAAAARNYGAIVEYVPYHHRVKAWKIVKRQISILRSDAILKKRKMLD